MSPSTLKVATTFGRSAARAEVAASASTAAMKGLRARWPCITFPASRLGRAEYRHQRAACGHEGRNGVDECRGTGDRRSRRHVEMVGHEQSGITGRHAKANAEADQRANALRPAT